MKHEHTTRCAALITSLVLSMPLSAHHSSRLFETTVPIWVKGTVVRFNWGSPHTAIIVEQVAEDGTKIRWALENSGRLDMLERMGYTRDSFKVGDPIEACGFAPKQQYASRLTSSTVENGAPPAPQWLNGAERVITARLLLTKEGPEVHWSHYGPLELCTTDEGLKALPQFP
jgi:Family of unknown function (DUF6152)